MRHDGADPSEEFLDLQAHVAGRFSLDRELGRGGMGIVFLARDVSLDRLVAIKLLPPEMAGHEESRERFLHEARTAAKLSHPNIVPIHGVETDGALAFFVMAYVDGEPLTTRLARGPLPPAEAIRMGRDIAWALAYAHSQGVIHRDIKPDNILLERGTERALVTDFGIAHRVDADAVPDGGAVFGTAEYMAPEQATGEAIDGRCDVYAMGVVLFLCLAGRLPFEAPDAAKLVAMHIEQPPPRLTSLAPGVPRRLAVVVDRCLAKHPPDRFASAAELSEALARCVTTPKEIPVPLRVFLQQSRQDNWGVWALAFFYLMGVPLVALIGYTAPQGVALPLSLLTVAGLLLAAPGTVVIHRVRKLHRAGVTHGDLLDALRLERQRRSEELAYLYGEAYEDAGRRAQKLSWGLFGGGVIVYLAAPVLPEAAPALVTGGSLSILGALLASFRATRRMDYPNRLRDWFWKSRIGRWLYRVGRWGIRALPLPTLTNRPTEMAVGLAVLSLYESLPPETRNALSDLPTVVQGLEDEARRMRERVEELSALAAAPEDGYGPGGDLATRRREAMARVLYAREAAQKRLADSVAALEKLRVDMLRMRAGTVNLASVTSNLGAARELAAQVDALLEGHDEIERTL
jgi:serine/threonine-protein kinase